MNARLLKSFVNFVRWTHGSMFATLNVTSVVLNREVNCLWSVTRKTLIWVFSSFLVQRVHFDNTTATMLRNTRRVIMQAVDFSRLNVFSSVSFQIKRDRCFLPHQESVHQGPTKFSCGLCHPKYYYGRRVVIHLTGIHKYMSLSMFGAEWVCVQNKICKLCNEDFSSRKRLRRHFQLSHQDWLIIACKFLRAEDDLSRSHTCVYCVTR